MCVGRSRKWNSFFQCELDDRVAWIKFVNRFAPARGGKFDGKIARLNEIERFVDDRVNVATRPMSVNFDQVQMR